VPWFLPALAGLGAAAGIGGLFQRSRREREQLEQQRETAWEQYRLGKEYGDKQYAMDRAESYRNLAVQRNRLNAQVSRSVDQMNTSLLAQAYGIQDARIQTASGIGASRAAEGMSGTRGNEAGELARAYAQAVLDRDVDLQRRRNDQALRGMMGQARDAAGDLTRERASWEPGGYRALQKEAQDQYNLDLAELGQADFNQRINQTRPTVLDVITGALGGAASGLALGNSIAGATLFGGNQSADKAAQKNAYDRKREKGNNLSRLDVEFWS
jgi:hypothetical protein